MQNRAVSSVRLIFSYSRLRLNANSAVDLRFDDRQRLLILRHGELVIEVAADAGRPFCVRTAEGEIRWSDPPFTEAIRRPLEVPLWYDLAEEIEIDY